MRGKRPGHGASQVKSDPDCRARSEMIVKLNYQADIGLAVEEDH
jgi:hypothetical protein